MDYISFNKNVNCLPKAKFDAFYLSASEIIIDAMTNPSEEKNKTLEELMSEYGLIIKNTDELMRKLSPAFTTNLYAPTMEALKACPACSVCALCVFCAEVNAYAGAATLAGLLSMLSK